MLLPPKIVTPWQLPVYTVSGTCLTCGFCAISRVFSTVTHHVFEGNAAAAAAAAAAATAAIAAAAEIHSAESARTLQLPQVSWVFRIAHDGTQACGGPCRDGACRGYQ